MASQIQVGSGFISVSPQLVPGFAGILQQQLSRLHPQPTVNVGVRVDQRGLTGLNRQVNSTSGAAGRLNTAFTAAFAALSARKLLDTTNQFSNLSRKMTAVAGAATAAGSVLGTLTGVVGGLGAGLAVAGAGIGAFAALAAPQISKVTDATDKVTKAQDAYDTAIATGDTAGAQKALEDRQKALASLTPEQRKATEATLQLKSAFKEQSNALAPVTLGVYTQGLQLVTRLLPALTPIARATGEALSGVFTRMQAGLGQALSPSGGLGQFLNVVKTQIGPVIDGFATILVNLGRTLSNVFQAAVPLIQPVLGLFKDLTGSLAAASGGAGLKSFFQSIVPLLNPLRDAITSVAGAFGAFIRSSIPLAGPVLNAVRALGDALRNLFNSAPFQAFVQNVGAAITSLTPLFANLVGPIGNVLQVISAQFAALAPALVPLITQFAQVFSQVLVGLSPLLPLFVQLAGILVSFLPIVYPVIVAFRDALAPVLVALGQALIQAQPAVGQLVQAFISMLPPLSQLLVALIPLIPVFVQALVPAMQLFAAVLNVVVPLLLPLVDLFVRYGNVLVPLIAGIWAYTAAMTALTTWTGLAAGATFRQVAAATIARIQIIAYSIAANAAGIATRFFALMQTLSTASTYRFLAANLLLRVQIIGLTIATYAMRTATAVATAVQWLWNAALAANPIGAVIVAVAALALGIFLLVTHFREVTDFLNGPWGTAISVAIAFVLPFVGIPMLILGHWRGVVSFFQMLWTAVLQPIFNAISTLAVWVFQMVLSPALHAAQAAFSALGAAIGWVWSTIIMPVFNAIVAVAGWVFNTILVPAFHAVQAAFGALGTAISFVWNSIILPVFNVLMTIARYVGYVIIALVVAPIVAAWWFLSHEIQFAWDTILHPVWNAIAFVAGWLWNSVLHPIFNFIGAVWHGLMVGISWAWANIMLPAWIAIQIAAGFLWNNVLSPIFGAIGRGWRGLMDGIRWVWDNILSPVFEGVKRGVGFVRDAFQGAIDGIKRIWDRLSEIFKVPVRIVIDVIDGFDGAVNWILDKVGLGKPMPTKGHGLPAFQSGGVIPGPRAGAGNRDNVLGVTSRGVPIARVEPEEFIVRREQAAKHRPLLEAINSGTLPGYSIGGWVKDKLGAVTPDFVGDAIHTVGDAAGWVADKAAHLLRAGAANAVEATYRGISGPLFSHLPKGLIPEFAHKTSDSIAQDVVDWIRGKEESDVLGSEAINYNGGPNTIGLIIGLARQLGSRVGVSSTNSGGHAAGSYHYRNQAVDFSDGTSTPGEMQLFNAFASHYGGSMAELFHTPAGYSIKDGHRTSPIAAAGHYNHVHVAISPASIARGRQGLNALRFGGGGPAGEGSIVLQVHRAAQARGWGGQLGALDNIISHESSWNPNAQNPHSTAHGLFQMLYGGGGSVPQQIVAGFNYIAGRYGNPNNAWNFWQRHHWYDDGGYLMPGATMAFNNTSKPEPVFTGSQWDSITALASGSSGGSSGPLMNVENMTVAEPIDFDLHLRAAEFRQRQGSLT